MPRVKRLHHHRPHHGTHLPGAGAPGKVPGWCGSKFERAKGTDCSVTGELWERPPSVQDSGGLSASRGSSGTQPVHAATGSSLPGVLAGDSRRTIVFRSRALEVQSGCSRDFRGLHLRGRLRLRFPPVGAIGYNWASCSESSSVGEWMRADILGVPGRRSSRRCSAALPGPFDRRFSSGSLKVVYGGAHLPVLLLH